MQYELRPHRNSPYGAQLIVPCPKCGREGALWKARRRNTWGETWYYISHHDGRRCTVKPGHEGYAAIDEVYRKVRGDR